MSLPVGEGFFYVNQGTTFTQTFVGDVVQGSFTNTLAGAGAYNAIGTPFLKVVILRLPLLVWYREQRPSLEMGCKHS